MKKFLAALGIVFIVGLVGAGIFFGCTPVGRAIVTEYGYQMDKAGENTYANRKAVEETLRGYYTSYIADKNGYEQYKDSTDEYYYNLAQSYKQRANSTAVTYNEYFTKNPFVFENNIPNDLPMSLAIIE